MCLLGLRVCKHPGLDIHHYLVGVARYIQENKSKRLQNSLDLSHPGSYSSYQQEAKASPPLVRSFK